MGKHRRASMRVTKTAAVTALAASAGLALAQPVGAACPAHMYAGQATTSNDLEWQGVNGFIDPGAFSLYQGNALDQQVAAWEGTGDLLQTQCSSGASGDVCWIQNGVAIGDWAFGSSSSREFYWEFNSHYDGYGGGYLTGVSTAGNSWDTDYFDGLYDGSGHPEFTATLLTQGGTLYNYGSAHLNHLTDYENAYLEIYGGGLAACPTVGTSLFGTPGTETYDSGTALYKTDSSGTTVEWTSSNTAFKNDSPFEITDRIHDWSAFAAGHV